MKKKIIIGLSAIFLVVFAGGVFISSSMAKIRNIDNAKREMEKMVGAVTRFHLEVLEVVTGVERSGEEDRVPRNLLDRMNDTGAGLSALASDITDRNIGNRVCGACHQQSYALPTSLEELFEQTSEVFSEFTMLSQLLVAGGGGVDAARINEELDGGRLEIQSSMNDLQKTAARMSEHVREKAKEILSAIIRINNLAIVVTIAGILLAAILLMRALSRPMQNLTDGTEAIIKGDYDYRMDMGGNDEVAILAERFNYMAEVLANRERRLNQKKREMEDLTESLEKKVRERTGALKEKQEELNRKYQELESTNEELLASYIQLESTAAELEEAQAKLQENYDVLKKINDGFRRANEVKNKFLSVMSHELRTPLTVINGYMSLVLEKGYGDPSADLRKILAVVKEQGKNQLSLIEDLLVLTRIESGEFSINKLSCDPAELIRRVIDSFKLKIEEKRITATLDVEENLPKVYWDYPKMVQVFQNLVDNALKFTPSGGWIAFSVKKKSDFIECRVSDNGIGIPTEKMNDIFDRFFQVDSSSTRCFGGSGLGLSIVREIVLAHKGKIFVESKEEKGTTFLLLVPVGENDSDRESKDKLGIRRKKAQEKEKIIRGKGETILVVDDDPAFLEMMKALLPSYGYKVRVLSRGNTAVQSVKEHRVDLVLLDLMMPETDGFQVCGRLRENPDTGDVPVIIISATGGKGVIRKVYEAGADDYLIKPFSHDELLKRIHILLHRGKGRVTVREGFHETSGNSNHPHSGN